jgi:hypothetical protein
LRRSPESGPRGRPRPPGTGPSRSDPGPAPAAATSASTGGRRRRAGRPVGLAASPPRRLRVAILPLLSDPARQRLQTSEARW